MLKTKIPLIYLILTTVCGSALSILGFRTFVNSKQQQAETVQSKPAAPENTSCHFNFSRLGGYQYIHPIYCAEAECEANIFLPLKTEVNEFVESMKSSGNLDNASVYVKDLTSNDWTETNPEVTYHPGSLFKVITMIAYFRMAEDNPGIFDKEVPYSHEIHPPVQTFNSKTITLGHTYKIGDLIKNMIIYSDNYATMLLHDYVSSEQFQKVFTDLGLKRPDVRDKGYALSVKEYSRFISVLYDGAYLTMPASDFAISLLSQSDFRLGIVKELPQNLKVAHKFGEAQIGNLRELHESAIVYLSNKPYLITIMTKGKDVNKLAEIISHISKIAYDHISATRV